MSPKTDTLSQPVWLKIQNSSVDYPDSPRIKDDIKLRIRSLLISRNNRYPPRTPHPSVERLRCYANSNKIDFLKSNADLPTPISSIHKSTNKCMAILDDFDTRETTRLNSIRSIKEENLTLNKEPITPSIIDLPQDPIRNNCVIRPDKEISRSLSLDKVELQGQKKIDSQDCNINRSIRSHSTSTSTDENSLHQLQHQPWPLHNLSSDVPRSISPELLVSPSDLSCFVGGCSPGHCNSKSHRRDSSWSAVREDDKFRIFKCHDKAMSGGINNRLGSEWKEPRVNLSVDLPKSNRMSTKETFIDEKLQSIMQTCATSSGTSRSSDIFPHALRSLNMVPEEIQEPIYSTTFSTNFSLPSAEAKNLESVASREETTNIRPEFKPSTNSNNSKNRFSRIELSDNSIRSKYKTPSLISTVSRNSARHGLLKSSITDNRPVDMGLAISPLLTHDIIYPNNFNKEIIYSESKKPILENEELLQSEENEISLPPSSIAKIKKPKNINSDSSQFDVKSLSRYSLKFLTPQPVKATSPQSFVDRHSSNNSDSIIDTKQSATIIISENVESACEIFPTEKKKDQATVTQLRIIPSSQSTISESLKTHINLGFSQDSHTQALKTELIINAETEPLDPETEWRKKDLRQQKSIEDFDPSLVQSEFVTSRDKDKEFEKTSNDSYQDKKLSNLKIDLSENIAFYPEMEKMNQETIWEKKNSNGYAPVPNQGSSGAKLKNLTSIGSNSPQDSSLCSKVHQKTPYAVNKFELDSISPAESLRSINSIRNNTKLSFEHSNTLENQENESRYNNTMNWLRNLISSNDHLENRLTALPSRSIRVQGLKSNPKSNIKSKNDACEQLLSVEPKQYNQHSDFNKNMPTKLGQKQRIDVSEAFANTINELEILMTEALSMARQATENHNPTQNSSGLGNTTAILKNGQNYEIKANKKPSNIDYVQKNLQNKAKKNETYYYGAEQTSKLLAGEKNLTDILTSPTDQPKKKSSQPSMEIVSTPCRLNNQNLTQNGSEALKFKYPQYNLSQKYDEKAKQSVIRNSAHSTILQPVIQPGGLSPSTLHTSAQDLTDGVQKRSKVSESHSVSRIFLPDQKSKKTESCENNFVISSQVDELNISKHDLNDPINQYDKQSHSQSSSKFIQIDCCQQLDARNKSKAQKPLDINKDFNHSLDGSAMTYSDVVDFNSGPNRTPFIRSKRGIELIDGRSSGLPLTTRSNHKKEFSLSGKTHVSLKEHHLKEFSLVKTHKRKPIARDWSPSRKRLVASVACISTALVGILVGIYAGETPAIQYYIADFYHYTVFGNVMFFFGLAIPTFFAWPLPLLHGRKPYILGAMSLAMPLLFPQALAVGEFRSPYVSIWRICLILPRAAMGFCLGFANMNFKCVLTDLFGASLQSTNPHQEHADDFDVRRHGGGMGAWLGLWTWSALGSIGLGFLIGATVIDKLSPSWGFYVSIIIIAFVMLLNVVCPEVRRAAYRRSVAQVVTEDITSHRLARGEVKMHMVKIGPKWWGEELQYGIRLSRSMLQQPGFLIMSIYIAWIYGQQVLITVLLSALLSDDYRFRSPLVGLSAAAIPLGALVAIPFQKASFFSRSRRNPPLEDDGTLSKKKLHWSSHMIRRAIFVLFLPFFGLFVTVTAGGPPIPFILPILGAGVIGFLSNLAMAECHGIIMETFDTSDLEPGMTGRLRDSSSKGGKPTNYSSFPRVSSAFAIIETFGYVFAAGASGIGGVLSRKLGRQAAIGLMASILLVLSILLLGVLFRFTEVQIIPDSRMDDMNQYQARRVSASRGASGAIDDDEEPWRPTIIGNPHQSTRRMCVLELGSMSRFSEIRKKNKLIDQLNLEAKHSNRDAINSLERRFKDIDMEIVHKIRHSLSTTSQDCQKNEELETTTNIGRRELQNLEGNKGNIRRKVIGRERDVLD